MEPTKVTTEVKIDLDTEDLKKEVAEAIEKANKEVMGALEQANKDVTDALEKANKDVEEALALRIAEKKRMKDGVSVNATKAEPESKKIDCICTKAAQMPPPPTRDQECPPSGICGTTVAREDVAVGATVEAPEKGEAEAE